jgi:cellulose synthase/poly-beta-1,6-N-acetylglucosamine synthase-like glycosyltransferase
MIFILHIVLILYYLAIIALIYGFTKVNSTDFIRLTPKTKFTIIVPFRDEAENLPTLLNSFSNLDYPSHLFEVILVDDDSQDQFNVKTVPFEVTVIKNNRISNSPKKDAITAAITVAKNDWIITTDADCIAQKNWLSCLDNYIQHNKVSMLAGAVSYSDNNSFLAAFQQLDLASLQGATMGSFGIDKGFMCNGANFAYTKAVFKELNGFEGNNKMASGDDVFLLQKAIERFPYEVHYLKSENNIIITKPLTDWRSLFHQRVRWASKTYNYQSKFGIGLGFVVLGGNLAWIVCLLLGVFGIIPFQDLVFLLLTKCVVDAILLYKTHLFLSQNKIRYLLWSSLFYPFFSTSVALYSLFGKYEWKGRRFSK